MVADRRHRGIAGRCLSRQLPQHEADQRARDALLPRRNDRDRQPRSPDGGSGRVLSEIGCDRCPLRLGPRYRRTTSIRIAISSAASAGSGTRSASRSVDRSSRGRTLRATLEGPRDASRRCCRPPPSGLEPERARAADRTPRSGRKRGRDHGSVLSSARSNALTPFGLREIRVPDVRRAVEFAAR